MKTFLISFLITFVFAALVSGAFKADDGGSEIPNPPKISVDK